MWIKRIAPLLILIMLAAIGCDRSPDKTAKEDSDRVDTSKRSSSSAERGREGRSRRRRSARRKRRRDNRDSDRDTKAAPRSSAKLRTVIEDVTIKNYRKVVYRGSVDLSETIARIKRGDKHHHRNDGSIFRNREGRLPRKPRGYYREYVHPTKGIRGAGPQRIVVGEGGEWYYTADHYNTFTRIDR